MRVFIAGIDGYLGWPLAQYLAASGHEVGELMDTKVGSGSQKWAVSYFNLTRLRI